MKKILAVLALGGFALMGCDSKDVNAQTTTTTDVGNPDSANVLIIEEGYQAVIPANANNPQPDWSQEGNVEVAPLPENSPAPMPTANGMSVDESVMESSSPNSATYEMNESISN